MKDNFSTQSKLYAQFRPTYPVELFEFLYSLLTEYKTAWDCGTGNGQIAVKLAEKFNKVYATDISLNQLNNAVQRENVYYKIESAEKTSFEENQFDLITVGQAIHWFDFEKFYNEVRRTLKQDGILAVIGYSLVRVNSQIDKIVDTFYSDVVGNYWDAERKYIDEEYRTIPFPFSEIETPEFSSRFTWSFDHMIGYLNTWSAVQHYKKANKTNPVDEVSDELKRVWKNDKSKPASFPILLRVGKLKFQSVH
jgi:ubiquinone/menaquinone biosynthesis C-methylase UbiE